MRKTRVLVPTLIIVLLISSMGMASGTETFCIKVQGTGDVRVSPTKIQMWIGAQSDGETAEETLAKSNETIQQLIEVFSQFGPSETIKTSEFNMYQRERWDDVSRKSVPEGFTVRQVFEVQILDITKVATFLDQAIAAGANIVYGLQYGVQDYRTPKEEAFKRAVEDAWWKAGILAKANNAGDLVLESIEETYFYGPEYSSEGNSLVTEQADRFMPGQLKVSVGVNATFRAELTKPE